MEVNKHFFLSRNNRIVVSVPTLKRLFISLNNRRQGKTCRFSCTYVVNSSVVPKQSGNSKYNPKVSVHNPKDQYHRIEIARDSSQIVICQVSPPVLRGCGSSIRVDHPPFHSLGLFVLTLPS